MFYYFIMSFVGFDVLLCLGGLLYLRLVDLIVLLDWCVVWCLFVWLWVLCLGFISGLSFCCFACVWVVTLCC